MDGLATKTALEWKSFIPFQLVSLLNMLRLYAGSFVRMTSLLETLVWRRGAFASTRLSLSGDQMEKVPTAAFLADAFKLLYSFCRLCLCVDLTLTYLGPSLHKLT
jgi:hypothetical protein